MKLKVLTVCTGLFLLGAPAFAQNNQISKKAMNEYVLIVRVPKDYSTEQAQAVNPAWNEVLAKWKAAGAFVTSFIIPSQSFVVSGPERTVKTETVLSDGLKIVSTIVLQAADFEAALTMAKDCPILDIGGTVELREARPRPAVTQK